MYQKYDLTILTRRQRLETMINLLIIFTLIIILNTKETLSPVQKFYDHRGMQFIVIKLVYWLGFYAFVTPFVVNMPVFLHKESHQNLISKLEFLLGI